MVSEGIGGYGEGFTSTGAILVLFILLVIISKAPRRHH
ncbi:YjcZ family sporulation protein [Paenibacillus monticola]